ncbi:MAG TPA: T9SS type A sorting domain-containing protein [Bacteroidales bacterium]|nr:T9SS type A sorting domain-containing protein [Bacteroidales bacterium]HRX96295.1 T9SS type A sorting domain-containing protein [Bacteroidales bacterium]
MKKLSFLYIWLILALHAFTQLPEGSYDLTQLEGNYVLVTITGPVENYATFICKGTIDQVKAAVFKAGEQTIDQNSRDNLEETIDLGLLPYDIKYFNGNNENMIVSGGNKLTILDGDTHSTIKAEFEADTKVSLHNMAFMPVSPYRNQIVVNQRLDGNSDRFFIICAWEGGGLKVIESEEDDSFVDFQNFYDDEESQLLSSSVHHYCDTSFFWVLNYWNGACKVKKYSWDKDNHLYFYDTENEFELTNNEIIDFQTRLTPGPLRIALLDMVLELDPITLQQTDQYDDLIVDKFEHIYAHIKGEHEIYNFETESTYYNEDIITFATSGCYDWDNARVYFTGYCDKELDPDFRVINYKPNDSFLFYPLDGAMDVQYNNSQVLEPGDGRVLAVGNNQIIAFDDDGLKNCPTGNDFSQLDCHFGYRIAFDANPTTPPPYDERIGITVACLIDGVLVQRKGYDCSTPPDSETIIETGISSSASCFHEDENTAYFFYNGDGGSNIYYSWDETNDVATISKIDEDVDLSESVVDCIYNKESNLVLASIQSQCDGYTRFLEIVDGNEVVSEEMFDNIGRFINFNNYVYCYSNIVSPTPKNYVYRIWQSNETVNKQSVQVYNEVNSMNINEEDNLVYGTFVYSSPNGNGMAFEMNANLSNLVTHLLERNDPVDICYIAGLDKIYIAQYNDAVIEVYNSSFVHQSDININGHPKAIEYNAYQREAWVISDNIDNDNGYTHLSIIDCEKDQVIEEKLIRRSDGYTYDAINDQLYLHTNYPYVNDDGDFAYNIKALNGFNNEFSNKINTNLIAYNDIYLRKERTVTARPSINHNDNYIYVGNYGSATATKIKAYDETFTYRPGWNWLSIPRLSRYHDTPFESIPILERIKPWTMEYLFMEYYQPLTGFLNISYNPLQGWNTAGLLINLKSSYGYKLLYENNVPDFKLRLEGAKLDYDTEINLVEGENWVGYYLDENYYPEQCIPAALWDKLVQIKTQYWSMTKKPFSDPPWFIQGTITPFRYGDLVILKTDSEYPGFQWQQAGDGEEPSEMPAAAYYSFEEQADYLPIYVETDSTTDIAEIAVLANGEVRGAAVRQTGDTLVEVNAYLEGVPTGTVLEFETWNGYKSKAAERGTYVVIDHYRKVREKRNLYTGEKATFYHVSLKSNETYSVAPEIGPVTCKPNPFTNKVEFSFRLNQEGNVQIDIFDLQGNPVKTVIKGHYPEGIYKFTWQGNNESGKRIKPGVYFYKVNVGNKVVQSDKLVMIK